ncbi:Uncharacterised protein [Mycobacteroides abscessus subsp. abscessus]|nr:Uncharacterised protein [Mycobacteroides abscessus subsp. abscessus]
MKAPSGSVTGSTTCPSPWAPVTNRAPYGVTTGLWSSTGPWNTSTGVPAGSVKATTSSARRLSASSGDNRSTPMSAASKARTTARNAAPSRTSQPTVMT